MEPPSFDTLLAGLVAQNYAASEKITDQLERFYPGQARDILSQALRDDEAEASARVEAVRGLGRLKDRQTVTLLIEALSDRDAQVRKEAARFLAPMHDARAVEPLVTLLSDPRPDVCLAAITPLGRHLAHPRAAEGLLHFLESADEEQRPAVITALSKSDDEQVMGAVLECLDREHSFPLGQQERRTRRSPQRNSGEHLDDLYTYIELVLRRDEFAPNPARKTALLSRLQKSGVLKHMLTALRATDPRLRARTASLLGQLEAPLASHTLLLALKDAAVQVRLNAIDALRHVRDTEALEALFGALNDNDPRVAARSIETLASINEGETLPRLFLALMKVAPEALRRASSTLARVTHPMAVPALIRLLDDPHTSARCDALYALARVHNSFATDSTVATLLVLLDDPEPEVRAQAASSLAEMQATGAAQSLSRLLEDSDPLVIRATALALGQLGDTSAVERLLETLHVASTPPLDRTWQPVQDGIIYALGLLADPRAVPALLQLLEQPDQSVHTLCMLIDALERIGDPRACEPLRTLREHHHTLVQRRAGQALTAGRLALPQAE